MNDKEKSREDLLSELVIANKELIYQNAEKEKRAAELIISNTELGFQNSEKERCAAEYIINRTEFYIVIYNQFCAV